MDRISALGSSTLLRVDETWCRRSLGDHRCDVLIASSNILLLPLRLWIRCASPFPDLEFIPLFISRGTDMQRLPHGFRSKVLVAYGFWKRAHPPLSPPFSGSQQTQCAIKSREEDEEDGVYILQKSTSDPPPNLHFLHPVDGRTWREAWRVYIQWWSANGRGV